MTDNPIQLSRIGPNRLQVALLYGLTILTSLCAVPLLLASVFMLVEWLWFFFRDQPPYPFGRVMVVIFGAILFGYLAWMFILELYFRPSSIVLSSDGGQWELKAKRGKPQVVCVDDLRGYSSSTVKLRRNLYSWPGIVLYHKIQNPIEVSESTLDTIKPLIAILKTRGIRYLGHETTWYPMRKGEYSFNS